MRILHMNAGAEDGGGKTHIISLLDQFPKDEVELAVFEDGIVAKDARELGIKVHVFSQKSRYDLSILKNISGFINEEKFDIVHTHGPRANFYVSLMKKKITAKWVTTIHSDPFQDFTKQGLKGWIFTKLNLKALKDIDLFFVVTNRLKKSLAQLGVSEEKMRVIYNGIVYDKEKAQGYNMKEMFHSGKDIFTAIQVARLHPVKGHEVLFDALQQTSLKQMRVLLVGDGPLETELKTMAKEKGIEDKVEFLGHRQDVKQLYASSHVNLLTSHSEGFPLVLLEAANQRVPSIVTRAGEIEPLIANETYGWIVPTGDGKALASALEEAYEKWKTGELAEMGNHIYEHAVANFSLQKLYEDTEKVYKELINS